MTKGIWKTLALLSLSVSALLSFGVIWALLAFQSNLRAIRSGAPICWDAKSRAFDSIAAAQMIGRLDLVSFILTTGGVGLAIFALLGWFLIRREAREEAREAATEEARKVAQRFYGGTLDNEIQRTYLEQEGGSVVAQGRARERPRRGDALRPDEVSTAGAVEEKPGAADVESKPSDAGDSKAPNR